MSFPHSREYTKKSDNNRHRTAINALLSVAKNLSYCQEKTTIVEIYGHLHLVICIFFAAIGNEYPRLEGQHFTFASRLVICIFFAAIGNEYPRLEGLLFSY